MAQVPNSKRFLTEDFPKEQQSWIGTLIGPLNEYINQVNFALQNRISVKDNQLAELREVEISVPATGTAFPVFFKGRFAMKGQGVLVANAFDAVSLTPVTTLGVAWRWNEGQFEITDVAGLPPGRRCKVTFYVLYG